VVAFKEQFNPSGALGYGGSSVWAKVTAVDWPLSQIKISKRSRANFFMGIPLYNYRLMLA
jgi:hypothetical protein